MTFLDAAWLSSHSLAKIVSCSVNSQNWLSIEHHGPSIVCHVTQGVPNIVHHASIWTVNLNGSEPHRKLNSKVSALLTKVYQILKRFLVCWKKRLDSSDWNLQTIDETCLTSWIEHTLTSNHLVEPRQPNDRVLRIPKSIVPISVNHAVRLTNCESDRMIFGLHSNCKVFFFFSGISSLNTLKQRSASVGNSIWPVRKKELPNFLVDKKEPTINQADCFSSSSFFIENFSTLFFGIKSIRNNFKAAGLQEATRSRRPSLEDDTADQTNHSVVPKVPQKNEFVRSIYWPLPCFVRFNRTTWPNFENLGAFKIVTNAWVVSLLPNLSRRVAKF